MFGIGIAEILVILVVLVIFIRPEDLPKVLRSWARTYAKAKKLYNEIIMVKDKILKDIEQAANIAEEPGKLINKTLFSEPSKNITPEPPKAASTDTGTPNTASPTPTAFSPEAQKPVSVNLMPEARRPVPVNLIPEPPKTAPMGSSPGMSDLRTLTEVKEDKDPSTKTEEEAASTEASTVVNSPSP